MQVPSSTAQYIGYSYYVTLHSASQSLDTSIAMLISLTVGKVDAGVAVLLTEDKRLVCASARS